MKHIQFLATVGLLAVSIFVSAFVSAAVGVSINVGQPGFYGQINLGDAPPPQLIYAEPMWIDRGPVAIEPIYLRVRPEHARHWRRYCGFYQACGRPVYFVQDNWYNTVYVPHYREHWDRGEHRGWDHDRDHHDHGEHRGWEHNHGDHDGD
ncbi:MAG: hypothetical protein KGO49_01780 [Gammaproteobacteria bacterium]|nr:hypothetical protein [Gammaproteobacteria bacterium]